MANEQRSAVKVQIAGEEYTLRTNADPEYTRRCAALVNERMGQIREHSRLIDQHKAAILAALSITDQYFQAAADVVRIQSEVSAASNNLIERIQGALED